MGQGKRSFRVLCAMGCGKMVLRELGECRKCRKARLRMGAKAAYRARQEASKERRHLGGKSHIS